MNSEWPQYRIYSVVKFLTVREYCNTLNQVCKKFNGYIKNCMQELPNETIVEEFHNIKRILPFKQGRLDGLFQEYHDSNLIREYNYKNAKLNGQYIEYYYTGKLHSQHTYYNDVLHGPYSTYYTNGKLRLTCNYNMGCRGDIIVYDTNGEIIHGFKD
jgi:antitoxin component YwqK of YwqJK toxin-antitoxin module